MQTKIKGSTAYVANIQKGCIHDGPGLRTNVFLMGCPLRCKWCQNPENLRYKPVLLYAPDQCTTCKKCIDVCPNHCNSYNESTGEMVFDRTNCSDCGACAKVCLTEARKICGAEWTVDELFKEVMKDEIFFRTSNGGVTFSGGEPTCHIPFLQAMYKKFREVGISTALETSGCCPTSMLEELAPYVDVFLYDYKADTDLIHKEWTGVTNRIVKKNLETLLEMGSRVIIRIPLIPMVNDGEEFEKMMAYLSTLKGVHEMNILPFHQFGMAKYELVDEEYELLNMPECDIELAEKCKDIAESYGFKVDIGGANIVAQ